MKIFFVNIALVFIVTLPVASLCKKWDNSTNPYILVAFALAALLIEFITGHVSEKLAEPNVNVNVGKYSEAYIITVESSKPLNSVAIDLPILGQIKSFQDTNSITDGITKVKRIIGSNEPVSSTTLEILIEDLKPLVKLEYSVRITPLPMGFYLAGSDRYKLSYTWQLHGELKTKTKWISLETGKETEKPSAIVPTFMYRKGKLTREEAEKIYENILKKHDIK